MSLSVLGSGWYNPHRSWNSSEIKCRKQYRVVMKGMAINFSLSPHNLLLFSVFLLFFSEILRGSSKQAHAEQSAMLEASLDAKEKSAQQGLWEKLRTQRSVTTVAAVATVPSANLSKWCKHEKHPSFRKRNSGLWSAESGKTKNCHCCCFFFRTVSDFSRNDIYLRYICRREQTTTKTRTSKLIGECIVPAIRSWRAERSTTAGPQPNSI